MRTIFLLIFILWSSLAWSQEWKHGVITKQAWMDQGGFHVEVDGARYLFMRDAKIRIDQTEHEVPDRLTFLTPKSRVLILADGFRIYSLSLEWRSMQ